MEPQKEVPCMVGFGVQIENFCSTQGSSSHGMGHRNTDINDVVSRIQYKSRILYNLPMCLSVHSRCSC